MELPAAPLATSTTLQVLPVRRAPLSAQSAHQAQLEAARLVSAMRLNLEECVIVVMATTKAHRAVSNVMAFAMAALLPETQPVKLVLLVSTWSKVLTPASQPVLIMPQTTT